MLRSSKLALLTALLWVTGAAAQTIGPAPSSGAVTATSLAIGGVSTLPTGALFGVNANTAAPPAFSQTASGGVSISAADAAQAVLQINSFGAHNFIIGKRSAGTNALPTAVQQGDTLLHVRGVGYDSAAYTNLGTTIAAIPTQNWTVGNNGAGWFVYATANNANANNAVTPTLAVQSGVVISGGAPASFTDPGAGKLTLGLAGTTGGQLNIAGSTSGTANIGVTATGSPTFISGGTQLGSFGTVSPTANSTGVTVSKNAAAPPTVTASILHLSAADTISDSIIFDTYAANSNVIFRRANNTNASPQTLASGNIIGQVAFQGYNSAAYSATKGAVRGTAAETWSASANGLYVSIFTTALTTTTLQENFRFQGSGGLSVGNAVIATDLGAGGILGSGAIQTTSTTDATTTTSGALQVAGGAAIRKRVFIDGITASAGLQQAVLCQSSGGEMIADSVACLASSARFKNVLGPVENGALARIMALPIQKWSYKPEGIFHNEAEHIGPVAEDVAAMDPRLAGYDSDGNVRTYSTEQLLAYTIKALQEATARIEQLERR